MDTRAQVKQYLDIAWRRRWWIVIPTLLGLAGSGYLSATLPRVYRATTTILVTRQSVPEDIVRSTVTMRIEERMKTLKVQVLSRTYLEKIAREIGAINDKADEAAVERACNQINDSVILDWDKQWLSWFRIMVQDANPKRAAQVANSLAALFIKQNTEWRESQARGTVETVDGWVKAKEVELHTRDVQIAEFKRQHIYELPDQEGAALQLLSAAQNRVSQLSSDIQLKSDRLSILRAEEKAGRATAAALGVAVSSTDVDARALMQLQTELQTLLVSYTDENPLVRRKKEEIEQFKAAHPEILKKPASPDDTTASAGSPEVQRLQAEVRNLEADRAREQQNVDTLRQRISNMPIRAQELATLTRDYDNLKREYDATTGQKEQAMRSQDIEAAKKGEQFQIQDRARPPAVPFKPDVLQLVLMGLLGGLGVGAGLATLLEFVDQSVRGEDEFAAQFPDLVILGSIPNLETDAAAAKPVAGRMLKKRAAGSVLLAVSLGHVAGVVGGLLS